MPIQQPQGDPPPHIKQLAVGIGKYVDEYYTHIQPVTPREVLQALEHVRYMFTEALINQGINSKKSGETK
jgi:hypothetical protein